MCRCVVDVKLLCLNIYGNMMLESTTEWKCEYL